MQKEQVANKKIFFYCFILLLFFSSCKNDFKNRINFALASVGGSVSTNPPFSIPSPAPYIQSIPGISNPYDCE